MRLWSLISTTAVVLLAFPAVASADFAHVVAPGESLYSVAAADGLSADQLAAANGLSPDAQLIAGSTLQIPPQSAGTSQTSSAAGSAGTAAGSTTAVGTTAAGTSAGSGDGDNDADDVPSDDGTSSSGGSGSSGGGSSASSGPGGSYVVVPGDTLSAIAARAGMPVAALAAANGLDPNGTLRSGSVLSLSSGAGSGSAPGSTSVPVSTSSSSSGQSASSQPVGSAAQGTPTDPPYPTPERVTASQVGQIAAANGVPPSLAQAIGWQESGFNNDLVSSADARGVMQILPGTWNWIGQTLAGPTPLAPASATDNVRAGVLLLHSLLNSTGGNQALAAAGYYQGLPSVQQHGLYSDTQQYVNSVMALQRRFGGG